MVSTSNSSTAKSEVNDFYSKQQNLNISQEVIANNSKEENEDQMPNIFYFLTGYNGESSYECCRMC